MIAMSVFSSEEATNDIEKCIECTDSVEERG